VTTPRLVRSATKVVVFQGLAQGRIPNSPCAHKRRHGSQFSIAVTWSKLKLTHSILSVSCHSRGGSDVSRSSYRSAPVRIIVGQFSPDTNSLDQFFFIHDREPAGAIPESVLSDSKGLWRHFRSSESFLCWPSKPGRSVILKNGASIRLTLF
jgi:hypothetical protein